VIVASLCGADHVRTAFEAGSVELSQDRFCPLRRSLKIWLDAKQRMFLLTELLQQWSGVREEYLCQAEVRQFI
jgi:hypothetical protein